MNLGIPWSCGSAPSQETEQIRHLLIYAAFSTSPGASVGASPVTTRLVAIVSTL